MRRFSLLLLVLAVAGCGVTAEETGAPGSSEPMTSGETFPGKTIEEPIDPMKLTAPPIVLVSAAGKQIATAGSSCVQYTDPDTGQGSGVCSDSATPHPGSLSIVHPGEGVLVLVAGAYVTGDGTASISALGCPQKKLLEFDLADGMMGAHTRIDLEPGAYEVNVFARFRSNDGRTGDVSGALGILVDPDRAPEIIPADAKFDVCQFPA